MGLDLLVFGDTAIDNFYEVDRLPGVDEASDILSGRRFYGGMGANTACAARKLGLTVGLVSVIGTDAEDYRNYMAGQGIKLLLKGIFGETTKSMFFKTEDRQISFFLKGVTEKLDDLDPQTEFGRQLPKDVKVVYMARTYLQMQKKAVKLYRDRLKVYNPGYGIFRFKQVPRTFKSVVKKCDILVLNHHELKHLEKIGYKPKMNSKQTMIVTRGERGASIYTGGAKVDVSAYETVAVDSSGAGDAFNAGFMAAHVRGYDLVDCVRCGNSAASFIVEAWGCQTKLPSWEQTIGRFESIR